MKLRPTAKLEMSVSVDAVEESVVWENRSRGNGEGVLELVDDFLMSVDSYDVQAFLEGIGESVMILNELLVVVGHA